MHTTLYSRIIVRWMYIDIYRNKKKTLYFRFECSAKRHVIFNTDERKNNNKFRAIIVKYTSSVSCRPRLPVKDAQRTFRGFLPSPRDEIVVTAEIESESANRSRQPEHECVWDKTIN